MFTAHIFLIVKDVIFESSLLLYGQTFKLFVFERERECELGCSGREREGSTPSTEPESRLDLMTLRS